MTPTPLPRMLAALTVEPGRPRLTWYEPEERVELSGHVLDNWVTKTANFLVEEFEAHPTTRVLLDLPPHWRLAVWALAVWRVGACVVLPEHDAEAPDLVITDRPDDYRGVHVVAVALPALARHYEGTLPPAAVDAASAVMTYGDVLTWMPEPDPEAPAMPDVKYRDLVSWGGRALAGLDPSGRLLVEVLDVAARADLLAAVLAVLVADGSLVGCGPVVAADLATDQELCQQLVDSELVTERLRLQGTSA